LGAFEWPFSEESDFASSITTAKVPCNVKHLSNPTARLRDIKTEFPFAKSQDATRIFRQRPQRHLTPSVGPSLAFDPLQSPEMSHHRHIAKKFRSYFDILVA
jgi:hypothetical protein